MPSNKNRLMAGNAYLQLEQSEKAIACFQPLLTSGKKYEQQTAEWYQAMAFLQMEKKEEAQMLLKEIYRDEDHIYQKMLSQWLLIKLHFI